MRPTLLVVLYRLALLVAVCASAALVIEYIKAGDPAFCGVGSACFKVRVSSFSSSFTDTMGGLTLPQLGLGASLALLAGSLLAHSARAFWLLAGVNLLGAGFGLILVYIQWADIGAFCPWCVAVDSSMVVAALLAVWLARVRSAPDGKAGDSPSWVRGIRQPMVLFAWAAAGSVAAGAPFLWSSYPVIPSMPEPIRAQQESGKVTMVGFTDFACPYCRRLHPELKAMEAEHPGRVVYKRLMVPLDIHPGAEWAAFLYVCTPPERREEMAELLYTVDTTKFSPLGVVQLAGELGLSTQEVTKCIGDPQTIDQVKREKAMFDEVTSRGLPTTFVGPRAVLGFNPDGVRAALDKELAGGRMALPLWLMVVLVGASGVAAAVYTRKETNREESSTKGGERPKRGRHKRGRVPQAPVDPRDEDTTRSKRKSVRRDSNPGDEAQRDDDAKGERDDEAPGA